VNSVIEKVKNTVIRMNMIAPGDKILVGLSGGADSVFLLLSLLELKNDIDFNIFAAHLNHCIRGAEADNDENFVKNICQKYNIELFCSRVNIPLISEAQKISEECAGRNERYLFFNKICKEKDINKIAVAHNKNDSVETVLLNLIRGSSLNGLCGIRPVNGNIIRPIIDVSRNEIEQYLETINQSYCVDCTNSENVYTRNKIRNIVLKSISEINPSVIETIYSNLKYLNNDRDFLDDYCHNLNCIREVNGEIIIDKDIFLKQHISIKSRIIMDAFAKINGNCNNITNKHVEIICNADKTGNTYNMPGNIIVKISHKNIIFSSGKDKSNPFLFEVYPDNDYSFAENKKISLRYVTEFDYSVNNAVYINADLISDCLIVRNRREGDKFIPYGMKTEKKLKQYFNDIKIPSYDRDKIPIILNGDEIVAILPYRISEKYKINDNTKKILEIKITKEENDNVEL